MSDVSVIIPVYNRGELIRYTLESVRRAAAHLRVETIVIDDGSDVEVATGIARLGYASDVRTVRQPNQGLLFARLAGLAEATGRYVLFLDSDDLVAPDKFQRHVAVMEEGTLDITYSDTARCELTGEYDSLRVLAEPPARDTDDVAELLINVQPAPHSPVFRTEYLRAVVRDAFFPPSPLYNPVAEIWFYHNAAPQPARVARVPGALSIVGHHATSRLTNNWERLAVASLGVMEAFARSVPATPAYAHSRRLVGEKAFRSWRRLPRGFSEEIEARHLALWRKLAGDEQNYRALGGSAFAIACRLLGPVRAGRLFRQRQTVPYETIRTVPRERVNAWLAALPTP